MISGNFGSGIGVMCASFAGCDKMIATLCFTLGMALMGFCYPSIRVNSLDLSPNYSSTIMALVNDIGCISGMATPYIVGILTPNVSLYHIDRRSPINILKCQIRSYEIVCGCHSVNNF